MTSYAATDVFTPNGVPTVTYVYREEHDLESQLKQAVRTPGQIISLSGPSKSGKTVLINRVIPKEDLILVSGASIRSPEMLWDRVLSWMEAPSETSMKSGLTTSGEVSGRVSGKGGIPYLMEGSAEGGGRAGLSYVQETTTKTGRFGIDQVVKEIAGSSFIVFIDDFHYMDPEVQKEVARQIKEASEKSVKICTASVPHRSDDVVRSNPELRGRVRAIDFAYWTQDEITRIGLAGFPALGMGFQAAEIEQLARQAFGSPQLMQSMCLQTCFRLDVEWTKVPAAKMSIDSVQTRRILEQTAATTDFSTLLEALHAGPKLRGQDRNQYRFRDGSEGDVYRCVLLAVAAEPPQLSLRYDEIYERTRAVCTGSAPSGSSVSEALTQMDKIAKATQTQGAVIEWDADVLDIADPYFLFYLRSSSRLAKLGLHRDQQPSLAL